MRACSRAEMNPGRRTVRCRMFSSLRRVACCISTSSVGPVLVERTARKRAVRCMPARRPARSRQCSSPPLGDREYGRSPTRSTKGSNDRLGSPVHMPLVESRLRGPAVKDMTQPTASNPRPPALPSSDLLVFPVPQTVNSCLPRSTPTIDRDEPMVPLARTPAIVSLVQLSMAALTGHRPPHPLLDSRSVASTAPVQRVHDAPTTVEHHVRFSPHQTEANPSLQITRHTHLLRPVPPPGPRQINPANQKPFSPIGQVPKLL